MASERIRAIQNALIAKGFLPGEVDGIWGRRTIAATKEFQKKMGLEVDGIVGPNTIIALFGENKSLPGGPLLPWLSEAQQLLGTKEVLGKRNNPVILDWADDLDIHYSGDEVPWCGLFVGHCVAATMVDEVLPSNPLGARQWEKFGDPIEPRLGAIMVFWRISKTSGFGHVGFYTGEDETAFRILGGNQSDKVCFTWISKDRFLKARWPRTAASLGGGQAIVKMNRAQDLSSNEA
ncbi:TIGR02594 family protein [Pseudomonas sp. NFX98]|uniref:NlpC/P60 family protein n=1 Tax=Pseudomonas sp. NFX98 TaxID=3399122 RepID=UPI0039FC4BC8